jgi:hypothetical protein
MPRQFPFDDPSRMDPACVNLEIAQLASRALENALLLRVEHGEILGEDSRLAVTNPEGEAAIFRLEISSHAPVIPRGSFCLGRHEIDDNARDTLRAIAFGRAGSSERYADINHHVRWKRKLADLPTIAFFAGA